MDQDQFKNPPVQFRDVTLWMLNDRLEADELRRQLAGFKAAGWGTVITRTFNGLRTDYLGEEWMRSLEVIVGHAREVGLKVWFQAGYMPNGIPSLDKKFEHKALAAYRLDDPAAKEGRRLLEDERFVYCERQLSHVLDILNPAGVREYLRQAYEETWLSRFGKDFGPVIDGIWVDEPSFRPPFLPWTDLLHERFARTWGYRISDHVPSLFRPVGDHVRIRHHYWRTVLDLFLEAYFKQVHDWCQEHRVRFTGHLMGEDRLASQIAWTAATMPAYPYMHVPGIDHLTLSLNWTHGAVSGDAAPRFLLTPKQCSSVANQMGQPQALAEMYGVSTEGITFEDRKRIGEFFAILGINTRCIHGSFYSLRGRRKRIYVAHVSHQQPWWADNAIVGDYFARLAYAMRQGRYCADVLVLHPVESAFGLFHPMPEVATDVRAQPPELVEMNGALVELAANLLKIHRGFDFGDETILARDGRVDGQRVTVGRMSYRAVVLPSLLTLRQTTLELLERFVAAGGIVLSVGDLPQRVDGEPSARIGDLTAKVRRVGNDADSLARSLDSLLPPDLRLSAQEGDARDIWLHERRVGSDRVFLLVNISRTDRVVAELGLDGTGRFEEWDCATGQTRVLPGRDTGGATAVRLRFEPNQSHLLRFRPGQPPVELSTPDPREIGRIALDGDWRITRHDPNAFTLEFCRFAKGEGEFSPVLPVIAVQQVLTRENYAGPVVLRFPFEARRRPASIRLVVEDPDEFRIRVNGHEVRYAGLPHYVDRAFLPIDITPHVVAGQNVIDLARQFQPLPSAAFGLAALFQNIAGVELEPIYLVGDFAVAGRPSANPPRPRCARYQPRFSIEDERPTCDGDLLACGYPFFAGSITLSRPFDLPGRNEGGRVLVRLPELHGCLAKVFVNGSPAGTIAWRPYELDISPHLRTGGNSLDIRLTNTLRNLIGPWHRPGGELDHNWGEYAWAGNWNPETRGDHPDWHLHRDQESDTWTEDYFFLPFGLPRGTSLTILGKERA